MLLKLFSYLICPLCRGNLGRLAANISCVKCHHRYQSKSGIPILIDLDRVSLHEAEQIDYFDREDAARANYVLEAWQKRYVENFLASANLRPGDLIIDDATGSGYFAIELARRGFKVIATDLTLNEVVKLNRIARRLRLSENILPVCCSSEVLPIKSEIADGLVANAILEHLPREKQAITEIYRVLKHGAPVMVAVPLAYHLLWPFLWLPNWLHDRRIGHLRRYTRESLIQKFRNFKEITTYYTGHLPKVICLGIYILTGNSWWNCLGEALDEMFRKIKYGASNIVMILQKA